MTSERNLINFSYHPSPPLSPSKQLLMDSYFSSFLCLGHFMLMELYMIICAWLFSLDMISRFIHIEPYINTFHCQNTLHCMDIPCFIYPFIDWWIFELFAPSHFYEYWTPLLWTFVCRFGCGHAFSSLTSVYWEVELLSQSCLTFWGSARLFVKGLHPFSFPPATGEGSPCSTLSVTFSF